MTGAENEDYRINRMYIFNRAGGVCEAPGCDNRLELDTFQWAHLLPQDEVYLARYGKRIIHHPLNAKAVCSSRCNDKVSMRQQPIREKALVARIEKLLQLEGEST